MTCQDCGSENPAYANFCMDCGARLTGTPVPIKIASIPASMPGGATRRVAIIAFFWGLAALPLILIVSAILIPAALRARMNANESKAIASLREINRAAVEYATTYGNGFPPSLGALAKRGGAASCDGASLLSDAALVAGRKSGYDFLYSLGPNPDGPQLSPRAKANGCSKAGSSSYEMHADPVSRGTTGQRSLFTDQTGIIRWDDVRPANANSEPLR